MNAQIEYQTSDNLKAIESRLESHDIDMLHHIYDTFRWGYRSSDDFVRYIQVDWYRFANLFDKDHHDADYIHPYLPGMKETVKEWYIEMLGTNPANIIETITGGTIHYYSDCRAVTVMDVRYGKAVDEAGNRIPKEVVVAHNRYRQVDEYGECEVQNELAPNHPVETFTIRKNGMWYSKGCMMGDGTYLTLGERRTYLDPSF